MKELKKKKKKKEWTQNNFLLQNDQNVDTTLLHSLDKIVLQGCHFSGNFALYNSIGKYTVSGNFD